MTHPDPAPPRHRRARRLILPRIQLRLIGVFLGGALLSALLVTLLVTYQLTHAAESLPQDGGLLSEMAPGLAARALLVSLVVALPLVALVGLLVTFRIAGPLYRFERYLGDVLDGRESGACKIRRGDEFQGLCDLITRATEPARRQADEADEADQADNRAA